MSNKIEVGLNDELDLQEPKKYNVFLLNDDYPTMDFVVDVLVKIFRKSTQDVTEVMLNIHDNGKGLCGIYTHEIALTKVMQVKAMAREESSPLKAVMEKE